ncbi:MAG TPA: anti-sigma factor antagonist [Leptospiraceae bacterium]|nr:anti-sigma factor antagonist [Leptospirales bacterium]HMU83935.1 anti-sigma factor antagonist [Leptospiraceae bacterium]HMX55944.1 anti-sigma factor antagonist [Leptospiraceae bacterium]HNE23604.1 anti-sigma factor antagonist [Leptospiraceae bacterium]HNJ33801.1 anti-sigma factor antagonist [Leptospiraceae bacterium]
MNFRLLSEYPELSSEERSLCHMLIQVETPPVTDSPTRRPLVVAIAIDKSKSMYGEKMQATLEAASSLVNWLTRHDQLAIIAYDTNVEVVQPLTPLSDKFSVIKKLENVRVGTATNLSGGWLQALRSVEAADVENAFRRVILLTDGMANTGIVSTPELVKIAEDHFSRGISTTTIGFGRDFSELLLRDVAKAGGGNFYFIDGPEQAQEVFFREFGDIAALFGQGLEIKLKTSPGVQVKEILNDMPFQMQDDGSVILRPGDLRSDDLRNIVVVLEIDGKVAAPYSEGLLGAELSFYNLVHGSRLERFDAGVAMNFKARPSDGYNKTVRLEALTAASARAMIEASRVSGERDLSAAKQILGRMVRRLQENEATEPDQVRKLIRRLEEMERNLEENMNLARKNMMAGGAELGRITSGEYYFSGTAHDKVAELSLSGQLDLYKCPDLKGDMRRLMEQGYRFVVFDLTDLSYVDSSGIGTLIQVSNWMKKRGGLMVLVNVQGSVEKIFQLSKLDEFFAFRDTVSEARQFLEELIAQGRQGR